MYGIALFRSWRPTKIPWIVRFRVELKPSFPIFWNQNFSPNCALGFLHLRPVLMLLKNCIPKWGVQLSNGMSSVFLTLVLQHNFWELRIVFISLTATSTPGWIIASWNTFILGSFSSFKSFCNRQEMTWGMMWDLSVHNTSLPFDKHVSAFFGVIKTQSKATIGLFVLFLLPPTVQLEDVSQHKDLWHKQHTNSCKQHVRNLHVLVLLYSYFNCGNLILRILPSSSSSFLVGYCISIQGCQWTYRRTALPYSFPGCWALFTLLVSVDFTSRFR